MYKEAADLGDGKALNDLGECYQLGIVVKRDVQKAFYCFTDSAIVGDGNGQYNLGCCYEFGIGTKPDMYEAARWYRRSAKKGCCGAQYRLGLYYEDKDTYRALYWFRKAAKQGYSKAEAGVKRLEKKLNKSKAEYYRTKDIKGKLFGDLNKSTRVSFSIVFSFVIASLMFIIPFMSWRAFDLYAAVIAPMFNGAVVDGIFKGVLTILGLLIPVIAIITFVNMVFCRYQNRLSANTLAICFGPLSLAVVIMTIVLLCGVSFISASAESLYIAIVIQALLLPSIAIANYRVIQIICSCKAGRIICLPINLILFPLNRVLDNRAKDYSFRFIYYPVNSFEEYGSDHGTERDLIERASLARREVEDLACSEEMCFDEYAEKEEFTLYKDKDAKYEYTDYAQNGEVTFETGLKKSKLSFKKSEYFCKVAFDPRSFRRYKD